ncbi:SbcC/MukB-like Walker B domain-containing protein [Streptomyces sp. SID13666]|uniref:SbcC/MukB-like Walker B domain-containing protein n=1 Tax=Streptomyces sp. SID13666 TaxID=2706054 RepID=UPI0034E0E320
MHSEQKAAHGARSGLSLQVIDAWNGHPRDTDTLSGGEAFFVSLALALALADVVTHESGGSPLDTHFIDEGFGSLDEDTLHQVLDVLDGRRAHDRIVGLISHIPDLRRRIPNRLHIHKSPDGSSTPASDRARRHQGAGAFHDPLVRGGAQPFPDLDDGHGVAGAACQCVRVAQRGAERGSLLRNPVGQRFPMWTMRSSSSSPRT